VPTDTVDSIADSVHRAACHSSEYIKEELRKEIMCHGSSMSMWIVLLSRGWQDRIEAFILHEQDKLSEGVS